MSTSTLQFEVKPAAGVPAGFYRANFVSVEPMEHEEYGPGLKFVFEVVEGAGRECRPGDASPIEARVWRSGGLGGHSNEYQRRSGWPEVAVTGRGHNRDWNPGTPAGVYGGLNWVQFVPKKVLYWCPLATTQGRRGDTVAHRCRGRCVC